MVARSLGLTDLLNRQNSTKLPQVLQSKKLAGTNVTTT